MTPPIEKAAPSSSELDPAAMSAIRNVMVDAESAKDTRADTGTAEPPVAPRRPGRVAVPDLPEPEAVDVKIRKASRRRIRAKRPPARAVILSLLALAVVLRPWLVFGVVFVTVFVVLGVFLALSYDGFWQRAMALGRWYAARRPERAAALHARLDAFAMKWDAVLDRFPEGTVDGLYLPDFGEMAEAEARHDAALDRRFDRLRDPEA